ncbi:MAG: hypothetical protein NTW13_06620 [Candidatus Omnitrophica bacterium]|nr:hypothetical protein [Candidatus Omnitrophota bacterium]
MNIFVGNLLFEATEEDVRKAFTVFGSVASVEIVMEKKGVKSRGFGFVQMPDEEEAQAAIAALNARDFMGRVLNVEVARPKAPKEKEAERRKKQQLKMQAQVAPLPGKEKDEKKAWFNPDLRKRGGYRDGRRTHSFMKRRAAAGITELLPQRKKQENPMRWKKKPAYSKPRQDKPEGSKPEQKTEGEAKPWMRSGGVARPWRKSSQQPKSFRFKKRKNKV